MARTYRTASGLTLNIDTLILSNEETISVGNMNINARGDELGPGGIVVNNRNASMDAYYKLNTEMPTDSAESNAIHNQKQNTAMRTSDFKDQLTTEELAFEDEVAAELPVAPQPQKKAQLRGNLAGAVAKQVVVDQPEITPPGQKKGPQRI